MNNKGFGIVELAAWMIVVSFCFKAVAVMVSAAPSNKLDLAAYGEIKEAITKDSPADLILWRIY